MRQQHPAELVSPLANMNRVVQTFRDLEVHLPPTFPPPSAHASIFWRRVKFLLGLFRSLSCASLPLPAPASRRAGPPPRSACYKEAGTKHRARQPGTQQRMKDIETQRRFVELRAQGWSFARIATELGRVERAALAMERNTPAPV